MSSVLFRVLSIHVTLNYVIALLCGSLSCTFYILQLITACAMQAFHALFNGKPSTKALTAELNAQIITVSVTVFYYSPHIMCNEQHNLISIFCTFLTGSV